MTNVPENGGAIDTYHYSELFSTMQRLKASTSTGFQKQPRNLAVLDAAARKLKEVVATLKQSVESPCKEALEKALSSVCFDMQLSSVPEATDGSVMPREVAQVRKMFRAAKAALRTADTLRISKLAEQDVANNWDTHTHTFFETGNPNHMI